MELALFEYEITGRNWGEANLQNSTLIFESGNGVAFEIPLADVAQCVQHNKNEVSVEFHQDDTTASVDVRRIRVLLLLSLAL